MLLGRLRIRGKLALLAAIPLLAVVALTIPIVIDRVQLAGRADEAARSVRVASRVGTLLQELQEEQLQQVGYLLGVVDRSQVVTQTATVTDRITDLRADLRGDLPGEVRAAIDGVRDLTAVRAAVLAGRTAPEAVAAAFTAVTTRLMNSLHLVDQVDLDTESGRKVAALDAVQRLDNGIGNGAALMAIAAGTRSTVATNQLIGALTGLQPYTERLSTFGTPDQVSLYGLVQKAFSARIGPDFVTTVVVNPQKAVGALRLDTLFPSLESFITLGRFVEKKIATEVTAEVSRQQRQDLTLAYSAAALAVVILLLVALLSVAVVRSVARPLIRLTGSADRVARAAATELERVADDESESATPVHLEAVEVRAHDEIGDLARAFERVQETAARLVERQVASRRNVALMFGHVGRRTQNLVGRQIGLIDQLEREETDPGRMQHLYRLDHVSSRLRRNAGSLVVLSGATGADGYVAPLPLNDVVRLALGEIEDFTRVDIEVPSHVAVLPGTIGDLVLVLAELMENATTFSPPDTRVSVTWSAIPGGAQLAITDHGLGLPAERLAEENARLGHRERLDLAPTEVLGLFVVGRLARRHRLGVALSNTPGGGVTATIRLGEHLLAPIPAMPVTAASAPAALTLVPDLPAQPAPTGWAQPEPQFGGGEHAPSSPGWAQAEPGFGGGEHAPSSPAPAEPSRTPHPVGSRPHINGRVVARVSMTARSLPIDVVALDRANRTVESSRTWNAFAPQARSSPAPVSPAPASAQPTPRAVLRQRVPGAQLPPGAHPQTNVPPPTGIEPPAAAPEDAAAAQALVEEFEAGVARALGQTPGPAADPPRSTVDQPGSTAAASDSSVAAPHSTAAPLSSTAAPLSSTAAPLSSTVVQHGDIVRAPRPGTGQLVRRVPGATLDSIDPRADTPRPPSIQRPPDPDGARELVEQFESGVARAQREARSDHRYREGSH